MSAAADDDDDVDTHAKASDATKLDLPSERKSNPVIPAGPDFGPRYRLIAGIGRGGMGEVFRAYDTELRDEVAIKVVRTDQDPDASLARFRREIALARKVTSPNVLRVYDLAEHDGLRFLSMQYVDGENLGAVLKRERTLTFERAVGIFKQVCLGVAAAHEQGVVHRDLKPQNVLVDREGHVYVADFGLARSIGDSGMTTSGAVLGSPAYMSPEQVKGEHVDERSDIYSLGILLYQLVSGQTPFQASTPHAVMEMRLHKPPRPLRELDPNIPAYIEAIVAQCLAVDPAARYRSVKALLADLDGGAVTSAATPVPAATPRKRSRWPLVVVACVVAFAAVGVVAWRMSASTGKPAATPASPSTVAATKPHTGPTQVLILGFVNHTNDPVFDSTLDLVFETALRRSLRLDPLGGSSLRNLASQLSPDAPRLDDALGKKLAQRDGRDVVSLHGSVTPRGKAFQISVTASDAKTGATILSTQRDAASLDDVLGTVGQLALDLRAAAGERIEGESPETGHSRSLEAAHHLAVGFAMCRTGNTDGCIQHLEQAIKIDSEYVAARILLGRTYANMDRRTDAREHFNVALRFIDRMGERDRLKFLGDYYMLVTSEYRRATAAYEELLSKWSGDMAAKTNLAIAYALGGDPKKALEAGTRAAREHPFDLFPRSNLPSYFIYAGQFEDALREVKQVMVDFTRTIPELFEYIAVASYMTGNREEATQAIEHARGVHPSTASLIESDLAMADGRLADAADHLAKGIAIDVAAKAVDPAELKHVLLAEVALRRGDNKAALAAAAKVTKEPIRRFAAALVQLGAGDEKSALATADALSREVTPDARAWGKLVLAEASRLRGEPEAAMVLADEANAISDRWIGHYLLARAALDAKRYPQAYSEIQTCIARRGEVVWVEYRPSLRWWPQLTYYLARARDGLGSSDAAETYRAFLALVPNADATDLLVADAKRRLAN